MNPDESAHRPVMVAEVLSFLRPHSGGAYGDCTCGHGHFALRLARATGPAGRLLCLDLDPEAVAATQTRLADFGHRCIFRRGTYVDLAVIAEETGLDLFDGLVIDAGCVSREQLLSESRGLSFNVDGELSMKLSPDLPGPTAAELVNTLPVADLARLFRDAGESSRTARAMASAIGTARAQAPVTRSVHLAGIIARAVLSGGTRRGTSHPATRAFLALRAAVTGELTVLQQGLQAAVGCLAEHGRLCVLTYYGTEHALVRQEFRSLARGCTCPPELPVCGCGRQPLVRQLTPRPLSPSAREVARNESARSARLSVCERVAARSPGSGRRSPAH